MTPFSDSQGVSRIDIPVSRERILSTFPSGSERGLPVLCGELLLHQKSSWPRLAEGYTSFRNVLTREVMGEGYSTVLQYNPARIASTSAKTDPKTIGQRQCFLCVGNLPEEQRGVLYRDEFLILCNPAPIMDKHLTIAHVAHIPQGLEEHIRLFIELSLDVSPEYTVFYNGPACGASAPDHFHFQASPTGSIPVEGEAASPARRELRERTGSTSIYTLKNFGRQTVIIEGDNPSGVEDAFSAFLQSMKRVMQAEGEPMVNVLCSYQHSQWRVIVFPRRKHRPEMYFREGDERVLVSPAAVDVGGLMVTPRERDFRRVDATMIQEIFDEVMMEKETVDRIIATM